VVRRRRWTEAEKGRIVAEAVAPGAVIAEVGRRHDLRPQHLSNRIKAAKAGGGNLRGRMGAAISTEGKRAKPGRGRPLRAVRAPDRAP
jgi:transposase-like protein